MDHENSENTSLSGRRLIDVSYFFQQLLNGEKHKPFECDITDMTLVQEVRKGYFSTFTLKCKMCNIIKQIHSENPKNVTNVNSSLVLGTISAGIGFSAIDELSAALNMPAMTEKTYFSYHEKVSDVVFKTAWKQMIEAGQEEADLAKELGEVDVAGIPCITVVADGAWSKRSYNVNYNAASGVVRI